MKLNSSRIMLYLVFVLAGFLIGSYLGQALVGYRDGESVNRPLVARTSSRPPAISEGHAAVEPSKALVIEEMNFEFNQFRQVDRAYALGAFFGGNRNRQVEAEKIARRLSYGKYDNHAQLEDAYRNESNDNAKRDIYNRLCYERLFSLLYLYETSRRAGLLVQPNLIVDDVQKSTLKHRVESSK